MQQNQMEMMQLMMQMMANPQTAGMMQNMMRQAGMGNTGNMDGNGFREMPGRRNMNSMRQGFPGGATRGGINASRYGDGGDDFGMQQGRGNLNPPGMTRQREDASGIRFDTGREARQVVEAPRVEKPLPKPTTFSVVMSNGHFAGNTNLTYKTKTEAPRAEAFHSNIDAIWVLSSMCAVVSECVEAYAEVPAHIEFLVRSALVETPFYGLSDEAKWRELFKLDVSSLYKCFADYGKSLRNRDSMLFWLEAEEYLTRVFNEYARLNIAPGLRIDAFSTDFNDAMKIIWENFPDADKGVFAAMDHAIEHYLLPEVAQDASTTDTPVAPAPLTALRLFGVLYSNRNTVELGLLNVGESLLRIESDVDKNAGLISIIERTFSELDKGSYDPTTKACDYHHTEFLLVTHERAIYRVCRDVKDKNYWICEHK